MDAATIRLDSVARVKAWNSVKLDYERISQTIAHAII
jgi:hypothetical protein